MFDYPNLDKLRIVHYPEPRLSQTASPIVQPEAFHRELAERMVELMVEATGVGLASNQVGWLERLIVISPSGEPGKAEGYLNPRLLKRTGTVVDSEGCLSVPGVRAKVARAEHVLVAARRLDGEEVTLEASGYVARAWQHEIDHLNGLLFVEKVGPAARVMIASRLRRLEKAWREAAER